MMKQEKSVLKTAMKYPSNHMHVMSSKEDLTQFWSDTYGLASENYNVIFSGSFRTRYGTNALHKELEKEVVEKNISLCLIDISSPIYDPFMIYDLKQKYDLLVVLLAGDDEFKFDWISSSYATIADLVITTDYVSVNRYRQSGVNAQFVPLPVYIPPKVPQSEGGPSYGVSFVGRVDAGKPSRAEYVRFLEKEIGVSIFGSSGPSDPAFLTTDEMYAVFRNSVVNLNFCGMTTYLKPDNVLFERIRAMKLRPFEITAAGGLCLSEFSISVSECFEDGVDIVFFKNKAELLEKIRYFLGHPVEAKRIAENGEQKTRQQFSAEATAKRLKELIQESQAHLGFDLYGEPLRVEVSRLFASSFMVFTLSNSFTFLFKGKLRFFLNDVWSCIKFLRRYSVEVGAQVTLQLVFIVMYKLGKVVLSKARAILYLLVGKLGLARRSGRAK